MMKAECLLRTGRRMTLLQSLPGSYQSFTAAPEKAKVTGEQLLAGSVYDYGIRDNRDTPENTFEGGADIEYGRFLDELVGNLTKRDAVDKI